MHNIQHTLSEISDGKNYSYAVVTLILNFIQYLIKCINYNYEANRCGNKDTERIRYCFKEEERDTWTSLPS